MEDEITMTVELTLDEAIAVSSVLAYVSDDDVWQMIENNYGTSLPWSVFRNLTLTTYATYITISEWLEEQGYYES